MAEVEETAETLVTPPTGPCSNYRVDLKAAEFGACKCGFPRDAHIDKGENKAAQALSALKEKASRKFDVNDIGWSNGEGQPCKNYRVDVSAKNFGDCKCGFPRDSHVDKGENNAAKALKKLRSTATAQDNYRPKTGQPCDSYKVDTTAEVFGTCLCGQPKEAHVDKGENKAAELLRKLKEKNEEKNKYEDAKAEMTKEEQEKVEAQMAAQDEEKKAMIASKGSDTPADPSKAGCCTIS